ncbi:hypothetical protein SAMN05421503_2928 [Terribacillus aidingensis]|jgi:hypothetical protein|uniref:Uncharacterized protein n=1 Tax=Terribacillus aidingensis TaxID=586416 RepID=A0A285P3M5_9BACI|nr:MULTISPECIES: hypothetical protein [Terribacillus]QXE02513.1 hypothetical protein KS242_04670 [Terribacillus sp. DMT04]SNZ16339.1 hypothetical protein SAMN05421503_2928 [Terribacillus aidingensis]
MPKKKANNDHQFKENKNHGEKRNGRLSQFKNNVNGSGGAENEYISAKED